MLKIVRAADDSPACDAALESLAAGGGMNCALMSAFEKHLAPCFALLAPDGECAGAFTFDGHTLNIFRRGAVDSAIAPLKAFLKDMGVFCVMGGERSVDAVLKALPPVHGGGADGETHHVRDMVFMEAGSVASAPLPAGYTLVTCGPDDADALFPLQIAYTKEEVLPPGYPVNPAAERLRLERALRSRVVLCVRDTSGAVCAKAEESVSSARYTQIGGVYTVPECRGRGLARVLAAALSRRAQAGGRRAVLYADERNASALRAYRAAGFSDAARYTIAYRTSAQIKDL